MTINFSNVKNASIQLFILLRLKGCFFFLCDIIVPVSDTL